MEYSKLFEGDVFTFTVGDDHDTKTYQVHAAAVENLSKPLKAMLTNGMKESIEKTATIKDVQTDVFELFLEFAYSGSYGKMSATQAQSIQNAARFCGNCGSNLTTGPNQCGIGWCRMGRFRRHQMFCVDCGTIKTAAYDTQPSKIVLYGHCARCKTNSPTILLPQSGQAGVPARRIYVFQPSPVEEAPDVQGIVQKRSMELLKHVQLYFFASQWMVVELEKTCIEGVRQSLLSMILEPSSVHKVVEAITMVYNNTSVEDNAEHSLRLAFASYAGAHGRVLLQHRVFSELIAQGGDFVVDWSNAVTAMSAPAFGGPYGMIPAAQARAMQSQQVMPAYFSGS